jgi:hypothetical protein
MKKFLKNIIIYLLVLALIISAVNGLYLYRRSQDAGTMGLKRNNNAIIKDVPETIEICNFGNSHGYCGFDYEDYEDEYSCFNFSLPSQSLSYDYNILQNYKGNIESGAIVFICVSYNSLYGEPETESEAFQSKNQRYYKFLSPEYIKEYDKATDIYINYAPVLYLNSVKIIKGIIGTNNFWFRTTTAEEAENYAEERYQEHVATNMDESGNMLVNQEELEALYDIISLCREIGARPILLTVPYLHEYYQCIEENAPQFFEEFYQEIEQVCENTGVEYFDYSRDERFADAYDLFLNIDHMNRDGARKFTGILFNDIVA